MSHTRKLVCLTSALLFLGAFLPFLLLGGGDQEVGVQPQSASKSLDDLLREIQEIDDWARGLTEAQMADQYWDRINALAAWDIQDRLTLKDVTYDGYLVFPDQYGYSYGLRFVFAETALSQEELLKLRKSEKVSVRCRLDHVHLQSAVWLLCSEASQ